MDLNIMHGVPGAGRPLRVLVIGNSFSRSLIRELPQLMAAQSEYDLDLTDMFIGGCSLERHINEYETAVADPEHKPYRIDRIAPGGLRRCPPSPGPNRPQIRPSYAGRPPRW